MNTRPRVQSPPDKPLMLFDGDCRFCALWIRRWQQATGPAVDYAPFQNAEVTARFPEITTEQLAAAVHLIEPDGSVSRAAEAVFRALARNPRHARWRRWYETSPAFARLSEAAYRFVAAHRPLFSVATRVGWGAHVERASFSVATGIFLRVLALIFLVAFASLWTQIKGLIGSEGILPAEPFLIAVAEHFDARGIGADRYRLLPTLCWLDASDGSLQLQCAAGCVLAVLALAGVATRACFALLWVLYLSLVTIGRDFLAFQWDNLLLEAGLLAVLLSPPGWRPRGGWLAVESPRLARWLLWWLLFRLMFESGVVKLASGDATWRNLTALTVHYETQPLPTPLGWFAHQLPAWFQRVSCAAMFGIELVVPFLIVAPRRLRHFGAAAMAALQVGILLTGNYTFFNWLTLALCLLLVDDFALARCLPRRVRERLAQPTGTQARAWPRWQQALGVAFAAVIVPVSAAQVLMTLRVRVPEWTFLPMLHQWLAPLRSVNPYGLFAVMTTERPEIVIEGSEDGVEWRAYEFRYKPGELTRRPPWVAPHQPRLDWQMWFEALRPAGAAPSPWFLNFCARLLQGEREVLALLEKNPFPGSPPRFVRAQRFRYRFTDPIERRRTGAWWKREPLDAYLPPLSLPPSQRRAPTRV
ncbi:MAG: lipase maturation factor family protein [Verrucomicrobiae bacterium]|nr:lipase maturation factor family protein [Verrucomicrobiae bacterium]